MQQSAGELYEALRAMYIDGEDRRLDSLMQSCRLGMEKDPESPFLIELLNTTINAIVNHRDRKEIDRFIGELGPEERELFDEIRHMKDDELIALADRFPQIAEPIGKILHCNSEQRRLDERMKEISGRLPSMY